MKPFSTLIFVFSNPSPSVKGMRPTATSSISASSRTSSPLEVLPVTTTPASVFSSFSSFVSTCDLMPRLRNDFASSVETSSSSSGTNLGNSSTIVVSAPKREYTDANSTPTAPAPMTISDLGISVSSRM